MGAVLAATNVTDPGSLIASSADLVTNNITNIGIGAAAVVGLGFAFRWFRRLGKAGSSS